MSAATRLRRRDETAHIVVFERGDHVSFANCGLPYFIGGVIEERQDLLLHTPESLAARFALDVRVRNEVSAIDPGTKTVTVREGKGRVYTETYDHLVLSPGASPIVPPLPGIERALTLRNIADVDAMASALDQDPRSAAVIGAGFIGLELAENLHRRGLDVTVVEASDQVMPPLDAEMAAQIADELTANGIDLRLGTQATAVGPDTVTLSDGSVVRADIVVLAVGVRPETTLAKAGGLALGPHGGIAVDGQLRTSDPSIYALGDAVEKYDALDHSDLLVPLANTANRQGRLVADVIVGDDVHDREVLGTAIVGVFGKSVAMTGWSEKRLRAAGRSYRAIHIHPDSHAGYYPGADAMSMKLLVDTTTDAILGAQGVGGEGVDKRIDVIATAMTGGITASGLADLELSYAPQFGSAKDPINMLGFIADNLRRGVAATVQWHELASLVAEGAQLVDVRSKAEHV
ncbi:MAG: FAD-dependent oxidoreductase, partial [Propionibacteriales bacterium]|nr:FAD-dependent oxidoreductase [Propionibacteriales bacterium]